MKNYFFIKTIVVTMVIITVSVINSMAFEFMSTNELIKNNSALLLPVLPDLTMPDFRLRTDSSSPGIDFSPETSGPSFFNDYEKLHKYLGYTTLVLAGVAAVTSSNKSLHYGSAYAATGTALLTCLTGYAGYSERFDLDEGLLSQDNLHILMGVIGTAAIATAVAIADSGDESSHAGLGVVGGSMMLASVVVIKVNF